MIQRPAVQMYAYAEPTPTIFPCAAGYSCMLPATATEKGYTLSSDNRPCAYIRDSGQLTAEYCYRPPLSSAAIVVAKKVYSGDSLGSGSSGGSGGAVQTFGPGPGAGIAAVVAAKPLTMVCTGDGMTYCPGWGCVDLRTNVSNCGSCGSSCINFTGCRDGKCYTELSMVGAVSKVAVLPKVAAVEGGPADQHSGMEHKALNPQPVPPLAPVHAVNGAGTGNGFLSPIFRLFVPAENSVPPTIAPVSAVSRNRGILESILAIFTPVKNEMLSCTKDADCPASYYCDQGKGTCEKEFITATISPVNATWGDTVTIKGDDYTHYRQVCLHLKGTGLPSDGVLLGCPDSVFSGSDGRYHIHYTWDTSQPLPSGYPKAAGVYTIWVYHYDYANYVKVAVNMANTTYMTWAIAVTTTPTP